MGELSEDMIEGFCCTECGIYFIAPHGYPVVCKSCIKHFSKEEQDEQGMILAKLPEAAESVT